MDVDVIITVYMNCTIITWKPQKMLIDSLYIHVLSGSHTLKIGSANKKLLLRVQKRI